MPTERLYKVKLNKSEWGYREKCLSTPVKDRMMNYYKYLACSVNMWHSIKSHLNLERTRNIIKLNETLSVLPVFLECFIVFFFFFQIWIFNSQIHIEALAFKCVIKMHAADTHTKKD